MPERLDVSLDESALLSSVLATAPVGLGFLDTTLRFVRLNEALAQGNGHSRASHVGRRLAEDPQHRIEVVNVLLLSANPSTAA